MELFEKGLITLEDTGDLNLSFGNVSALEAAVRMTALREGVGNRLAEGSFRLAASCGHPEYSMTVKKLEIPAYDPRASFTQALGYMTSPSGACHLRGGYAVSLAFFGGTKEIPRYSLLQSPIAIRNMQNLASSRTALASAASQLRLLYRTMGPWPAGRRAGFFGQPAREIANRIAALKGYSMWKPGDGADDDLPARFGESPSSSRARAPRPGATRKG
jgi:aldehyde:ferredoxin oxidoreductase